MTPEQKAEEICVCMYMGSKCNSSRCPCRLRPAVAAALQALIWQPPETAPRDGLPVDLWLYWPEHNRARRSPDAVWTGDDWKIDGFTIGQYAHRPKLLAWMRVAPPTLSPGGEQS